jgi:hypothetical protein
MAPLTRPALLFSAAFVAVTALLLAGPLVDPGLATFWDRTVTFQANRDSPFSIWGQVPSLHWLHVVVEAVAVALAIVVAFAPARRTMRQFAALGAAVMIAVELTADHWFYLYIPWFFPLVIVALALTQADGVPGRGRGARREGRFWRGHEAPREGRLGLAARGSASQH